MNRLTTEQMTRISKTIEVPEVGRIVLVDVSGQKDDQLEDHNQNIYCIDEIGNIKWQIQADSTIQERDSFTYLFRDDKGMIHAERFFGNEFIIDPIIGKAELTEWHK